MDLEQAAIGIDATAENIAELAAPYAQQGGSSAATAPSGGGGGGGKAHGRYERSDDEGSSSPESSRLLQPADTRQFPSVTRRKSIDRFEEF